MHQSFPPQSAMRSVKSIKVDVQTRGEGMLIMDKILKQTIQGDLTNAGVKVVHDDNGDCDAILFCNVVSMLTASDDRGRPAGYAFALTFNLMTSLHGQPADELFVIWNEVAIGSGNPGSLYNQLVSAGTQLSFKLISRLQER